MDSTSCDPRVTLFSPHELGQGTTGPSPSDEQAKVAKDIFSKYNGAKDNSDRDNGGRKKLPATSYIRCLIIETNISL